MLPTLVRDNSESEKTAVLYQVNISLTTCSCRRRPECRTRSHQTRWAFFLPNPNQDFILYHYAKSGSVFEIFCLPKLQEYKSFFRNGPMAKVTGVALRKRRRSGQILRCWRSWPGTGAGQTWGGPRLLMRSWRRRSTADAFIPLCDTLRYNFYWLCVFRKTLIVFNVIRVMIFVPLYFALHLVLSYNALMIWLADVANDTEWMSNFSPNKPKIQKAACLGNSLFNQYFKESQ